MKSFQSLRLTLRYHNKLNIKFWDDEYLRPEVREKLIQIGYKWADFAKIPNEAIKDIILVGGNANYNYTRFSDLDLHLVVDKTQIADCPEILDDYLRDKKKLWALVHDIKIYSHPVELYAQDENDPLLQTRGYSPLPTMNGLCNQDEQRLICRTPCFFKKFVLW